MWVSWQTVSQKIKTALDQFTESMGQCISWLGLLLVICVFLVVLLRYGFNIGSIALQDSALYLHSLIFLGASAFTLKRNGHVRVDVFYRKMTIRQQALVNTFGTVFLLFPVCLFIGYSCWDYVVRSWIIQEASQDPGGLPFVYVLKTFLLVLVVTLLLQGFAELLRALLVLFGQEVEKTDD